MASFLIRYLKSRDQGLLAVSVALLALGLLVAFGALYSIPLGLGDKKAVTLLGWTLERRVTYQAAFAAAAANLLVLLLALAVPRGAARGFLRPALAALNAAAIVFLAVRSEDILERREGSPVGAAAYNEMPPAPYDDPAFAEALIRVDDAPAAEAVRQRLIVRIFGDAGLPAGRGFDTVERGVEEPNLAGLPAARIDRMRMALDHGYGATAYHLVPEGEAAETLVLYNHGHVSDIFGKEARHAIEQFLRAGHAVTALSMPNRRPNTTPGRIDTVRHGSIANRLDHESFSFLETAEYSPIRLFVAPLVAAVDQGLADGYETIAATGISGGAWSITVAAAVDRRIQATYPVAGSLPMYLLALPPNRPGDWEQVHADIYRIASYLDLYVLGAAGQGRRQIQILNQYDSCCFRGIGARGYASAVAEATAALGGRYELVILPEHDHRIAPEAFDIILEDLNRSPDG
ncbi:hypothetical protein C882_1895 [Caenispirillum salinarum AK4]|uniref:Uncharacterized protein n=1 Tax=Caenispirillum salinarum AK4 TaxID=1238182 RepID=K9H9U6_9PROT|nr:hypothetical protein [Caenispirillum salinarum]EKV27393.1 hypothetical protein C882_1895 [Caenispirillum salinarum AK4]